MKQELRVTLVLDSTDFSYDPVDNRGRAGLCAQELDELFAIPESVTTIDAILTTERVPESYQVEIHLNHLVHIHFESEYQHIATLDWAKTTLNSFLKKAGVESAYLSIEY